MHGCHSFYLWFIPFVWRHGLQKHCTHNTFAMLLCENITASLKWVAKTLTLKHPAAWKLFILAIVSMKLIAETMETICKINDFHKFHDFLHATEGSESPKHKNSWKLLVFTNSFHDFCNQILENHGWRQKFPWFLELKPQRVKTINFPRISCVSKPLNPLRP